MKVYRADTYGYFGKLMPIIATANLVSTIMLLRYIK